MHRDSSADELEEHSRRMTSFYMPTAMIRKTYSVLPHTFFVAGMHESRMTSTIFLVRRRRHRRASRFLLVDSYRKLPLLIDTCSGVHSSVRGEQGKYTCVRRINSASVVRCQCQCRRSSLLLLLHTSRMQPRQRRGKSDEVSSAFCHNLTFHTFSMSN